MMNWGAKTAVVAATIFLAAVLVRESLGFQTADPLTYPELITALQSKLPNAVFKTRDQVLAFVISQVRLRKLDKPLTKDREEDLRQAGATEALIGAIRSNSPAPVEEPIGPVELGDLTARAINLVKPEYTDEARRARTSGQVKLVLELDDAGRVVSVSRLTVLPNGLTDSAIEAARRSTFRPATRDGKPAPGTGVITYNFKINAVDTSALLAAANGFRAKRQCDEAIREYSRVLEVEPRNPKALLGRGTCHLMEANYSLAEADLANAVSADKQDADIYFYLAVAQDFKGENRVAADNYAAALKLRPDFGTQPTFKCLYIDRRSMSADEGRKAADDIIDACSLSFRGASDNLLGLLYFKRGIAYRLGAQFDNAISDFETVRRMNPQFTAVNKQMQLAYNGRGLAAFNRKEFGSAFDDISKAIQADPADPTPYINRCAIYLYARKKYREAVEDCSTAIRLGTRSSGAYIHRGYAYELMKDRASAIADYKKAVALDPANQRARSGLERLEPTRPSIKNY